MKTCYPHSIVRIIILCLMISCPVCSAAALPDYIPENLKLWSDWVLHYKTESLECIPHFNDSDVVKCAFPSSIVINLNNNGGAFTQEWQIYHETYIALPGNGSNWPRDVMANGIPAIVIQQNDTDGNIVPAVKLLPGRYTITGRFIWQKQPEYIQVPPESALVTLKMDNSEVEFPNLDDAGRLWLKTTNMEQKEENRLKVESFRLIDDGIPPQMILYTTLDVAGVAREVKLGPLYSPQEFIPLTLDTQLPSKLESDGTIKIQVKPGRHSLTLKLRHLGQIADLTFEPPEDGYWQKQEIWSVVRRPDLRVVEISGVPAIDPRMTSLPESWKSYPAYMMLPKETMKFKEVKRGDPVPPPDQLNLHRTLWLAFDGSGYTVQDTITGNKNSGWRLEIEPLIHPGKVTVDGVEQLITKKDSENINNSGKTVSNPNKTVNNSDKTDTATRGDASVSAISERAGVELRHGNLNLVAESRIKGSVYTIPATGWVHSFQKVTGTLNLPPGWKLVAAQGIDNIQGTWIKQWSLLDIFIVLIFTIATAKLFSLPLAAIGFITLMLLYHEPGAPRYIWLFLLLGFVLLDITRKNSGRLIKMVKVYQFTISIIMLIISISYAINSLRVGIYPQLENRWISMNDAMQSQNQPVMGRQGMAGGGTNTVMVQPESKMDITDQEMNMQIQESALPAQAPSPRKAMGPLAYLKSEKEAVESLTDSQNYGYSNNQRTKVMQYDPKSLTQTGPGLPLWQPFRTIRFSWSGPVEPGQKISFTLIGPTFNLFLAFLRVSLIILLATGMFMGAGFGKRTVGTVIKKTEILTFLLISASFFIMFTPCLTNAGEIPSPEMLAELQNRLLEKDKCFPSCADISQIGIDIENKQLKLTLNVDAAVDTVIPLPGHARHWLPEQVLISGINNESLNNSNVNTQSLNVKSPSLFRLDQILWVMVPAGKHILTVLGRIGNQGSFQLPLTLKPHSGKVINASGWEVQGVQPDSTLDDQIQFRRYALKSKQATTRSGETPEDAGEIAGVERESQQDEEVLETGLLPPFALVERTLLLGLNWKVETTVQRLTPIGSAIVLKLPLLAGESVITEGIRVKNGMAEITLNASQNSLTFESFLEISDNIKLYHALTSENNHNEKGQNEKSQSETRQNDNDQIKNGEVQNREWTEIWRLDASPVFHIETEGIPVILHQNNERWYPTWHPWPGEEVILKISRPKGIDGQTMTIEKSTLELHPGQRSSRSILTLSIKSSQGGQHSITIPEGAELQEVKINGGVQLLRQEGAKVILPITPGGQNIELVWKDEKGITTLYRTPAIDLGSPSVNAAIDLHISSDRWTLFVGGEQLMGPAVLFWSQIVVVLLVSIGLAITGLTPLNFYQWFLLGIGMAMSNVVGCLFVATWLVVLDMRKKWGEGLSSTKFNIMQLSIAGLTFFSIICLLMAISQGLLGHPSMNITGNGSSGMLLRWYQDIIDTTLPVAWLFSLPMVAYRIAMLLWALWLSFWLVAILKWGWNNFATPVLWVGSTKPEITSQNSASGASMSEKSGKVEEKKRSCWTKIRNLFRAGKG